MKLTAQAVKEKALAFGADAVAIGDIERWEWARIQSKPGWWSPFRRKPRNLYNTGQAVCGARGCPRACMNARKSSSVLSPPALGRQSARSAGSRLLAGLWNVRDRQYAFPG